MKKVTLGAWEGTPVALIANPEDGTMEGYIWTGFGWRPGFTEEAFAKATALSEQEFAAMFPKVEPPR